ncbi:13584_t:CDS:2 [Entrophospora sp. SA101]|nr:13584_t:CDS:2 [Entrophospora sp. SA101]CAJ0857251.1 14631_t:CDS:2 [Entrophospora sp. SA101]
MDLDYLPGHFIEIQSRLKGQMVIRNYSPIDGKIMKSFSILVKIYPNGPMSKHLNNRLIGFEIQARGPFDIGTGITPMIQLIKFHLKHYNFNNNNSKLSMHLIYANKSVDDSIVNLKDCYYHSLNNNNTNDNTNIDDVLIRKSGLEGKVDKDILENWFKNTIINEKEIEQKVGRGWESGKETFTGDLSKNPLDNYNNDSSFGLQSSSSSLSISSIPSLSSPSLAAAVEASSSVQPTATATATSSNFLKQSSFSLNRKIHKPPPRLNLVTDIYNCNNDNDNNLQKVQMEGRFDSISSRPNSKIFVCGPINMMISIDQILHDMNFNENDYILLI